MSFANCALPYYIGNVIEDRRKVLAYTPDQFYDKKHITVKHTMKLYKSMIRDKQLLS